MRTKFAVLMAMLGSSLLTANAAETAVVSEAQTSSGAPAGAKLVKTFKKNGSATRTVRRSLS